MPIFESMFGLNTHSEDFLVIESPVPLKPRTENKDQQTTHSLPIKLETKSNQLIPKDISMIQDSAISIQESEINNSIVPNSTSDIGFKDKLKKTEVKPLRLNRINNEAKIKKQKSQSKISSQFQIMSKVDGMIIESEYLSLIKEDRRKRKNDERSIEGKSNSLNEKLRNKVKERRNHGDYNQGQSLKGVSRQEAPKRIFRSNSRNEDVQMKFMKTTYEDPVQCKDTIRMAPVKINDMGVESVRIKDGK